MQRVLITGANRGIGLAIVKKFLGGDFEICAVTRNSSKFPVWDAKITQYAFDLREVEQIPELAKNVGHIDILINNAGIMSSLPPEKYSEEKKREVLAVNLEAPIALMTEFSKSMVKKGRGRIVNVTSIASHIGHPDIWYGATKAGLTNATKSFAKILAGTGVTVNAVAPGPVETDMLHQIPEERLEGFKKSMLGKVFATPQQIADVIYWIATEAPEQINGSTVDVNDGILCR